MSGSSTTKPMDVYSAYMDIPFDVAAYARGHKFCVEAVNLSRAIKHRQQADEEVRRAAALVDKTQDGFRVALEAMREKMKRDPA